MPVQKSAFADPANRPTAQRHYDSLRVIPCLDAPERLLVVDDIVTRGATLLATAARVLEAFPAAEVRGFALLRTESGGDISSIRDPQVGEITRDEHGRTFRRP